MKSNIFLNNKEDKEETTRETRKYSEMNAVKLVFRKKLMAISAYF